MYHTHNLRHKNTQNISDKHHNSQIIIQYSDNLWNFHSILPVFAVKSHKNTAWNISNMERCLPSWALDMTQVPNKCLPKWKTARLNSTEYSQVQRWEPENDLTLRWMPNTMQRSGNRWCPPSLASIFFRQYGRLDIYVVIWGIMRFLIPKTTR